MSYRSRTKQLCDDPACPERSCESSGIGGGRSLLSSALPGRCSRNTWSSLSTHESSHDMCSRVSTYPWTVFIEP